MDVGDVLVVFFLSLFQLGLGLSWMFVVILGCVVLKVVSVFILLFEKCVVIL